MVYKKYIKRDGKIYGPYLYKSIKRDGKVITEYIGHHSEIKKESAIHGFHGRVKNNSRRFWTFAGIFCLISVVLIIGLIFLFQFGATGKASIEIQGNYLPGEQILGNLNLILKQGELIPVSTKLIVDNSGEISEYDLNDLIGDNFVQGDFFIEDRNVAGNGDGFGVQGEKEIYPLVDFSFRVVSLEKSQEDITAIVNETETNDTSGGSTEGSTTDGETTEQTPTSEEAIPPQPGTTEEQTPPIPAPEQTTEVPLQETPTESDSSDASSSESSSPAGESSGSSDTGSDAGGITGGVISGEIIQGQVSKSSPFEYILNEGESVEIVDSSQLVSFQIENGKAIFTTGYYELEKGFGSDYLKNEKVNFPIDLSQLNLIASEGILKFSFVYGGIEITSSEKQIFVEEVANETLIDLTNLTNQSEFNITNFTEFNMTEMNVSNFTIEGNFTVNTTQFGAVLGQPVKWKKEIEVSQISSLRIDLPKIADKVLIKKINDDGTEEIEYDEEGEISGQKEKGKGIEENSVNMANETAENETETNDTLGGSLFTGGITGDVVQVEEAQDSKDVVIDAVVGSYEVEYETPAPTSLEGNFTEGKKEIVINGNDELHYQNVLAFSQLPYEIQNPASAKIYWLNNGNKELANSESIDSDGNGLYDYVQWIVPQLSNQTYELSITIINVQSYPTVGGNWTVEFTTTGQADLRVTPVNETSFGISAPDDLEFLEIKCGSLAQNYTWENSSVLVSNYSCNETGYEISLVITPGKHDLEFDYGGIKAQAHNDAGPSPCTGTSEELICDSFNDNSLNTSLWGVYADEVNASLNETSQNVVLNAWNGSAFPVDYSGVGLINNNSAHSQFYGKTGVYSLGFNYYPNNISTAGGFGRTGLFIRSNPASRESVHGAPKGKSIFIKLGGWSQGLNNLGTGIYYYDNNLDTESPYIIGQDTSNIFSSVRWYNISVNYNGETKNISVYVDGNLKASGNISDSNFSQISNNIAFEFYASSRSDTGNRINTYDNIRINSTGLPYTCGSMSGSTTLFGNLGSTGTCININSSNVVLDCNGYKITYGSSLSGYGVSVNGYNNITIKNCVIEQGGTSSSSYGIYVVSSNNSRIESNYVLTRGSNSDALRFTGIISNDSILSNNVSTTGGTSHGINLYFDSAPAFNSFTNSSISSNYVSTTGSNSFGINLQGRVSDNTFSLNTINASGNAIRLYGLLSNFSDSFLNYNNSFFDSVVLDAGSYDVYVIASRNNKFINVSFNESNYFVSPSGSNNFTVIRYGDVNVTDSLGQLVSSASVSAKDVFNDNSFSGITNASGILAKQQVFDYTRKPSGVTTFYNNHTLNVTKSGYLTKIVSSNFSSGYKVVNVVLDSQTDTCNPIPGNDLVITTSLVCPDSSINVRTLNITSTGNLTLIRGNLSVNQTIVGQGGSLTIKDSKGTIWQNGNLTISGTYVLDNSTLRMNGTTINGSIGINVTSTGNMTIKNQSNVTNGENAGYRYFFVANSGSNFSMNSSSLSYAGWNASQGQKGLEIYGSVLIFKNNIIKNNFRVVIYSTNNIFENNTFMNHDIGVNLENSNNSIINNTFINNNKGIFATNAFNSSILDNYFAFNSIGMELSLFIDDSRIFRNKIYNSTLKALSLYSPNVNFSELEIYNASTCLHFLAGNIGSSFLKDSSVKNCFVNDVYFDAPVTFMNIYFLNVSFNKSKVGFHANSVDYLAVQWYLDVNVSDSATGIPINAANATVSNVSGASIFSELTSSSGLISRQNITEYSQNRTAVINSNNYSINVTKAGYFNYSGAFNITSNLIFNVSLNPLVQYNTCSPTSGSDLLINTTISCENRTIIVNTTNVTSTGSLTLVNSTLISGDTSIYNGGSLSVYNSTSTIWQNDNLTVFGSYVLDNSTLRINGTSVDGSIGINVTATGKINITRGSLVTYGNDASFRYFFLTYSGSTLYMKDSVVEYSGWASGTGQRGLEASGFSNITSSTFRNNYHGLVLKSDGNFLYNDTFVNNSLNGLSVFSSFNTLNSLFSRYNSYGVYLQSSGEGTGDHNLFDKLNASYNSIAGVWSTASMPNITLINSYIGSTPIGMQLTSSTNSTIKNNTFYNNSDRSLRLGSTSNATVEGNIFNYSGYGLYLESSTGIVFENNSAFFCATCYFLSDQNNSVFKSNNITNSAIGLRFSSSNNNTLNGFKITNSTSGLYFLSSNNNIFSKFEILNSSSEGIFFASGLGNIFRNFNLSRNTYSIQSSGSALGTFNNILIDSFSSPSSADARFNGNLGSANFTFLNVSSSGYSTSFVSSNCSTNFCNLYVKWYFDLNVTNSSGALPGASVSAWNNIGGFVFSDTTNLSGQILRQNITAMLKSFSSNTTYNNHTINIAKSGYGNYSESINISGNKKLAVFLNALPFVSNVALNASSANNLSTDNLSVYYSKFDSDNDNVTIIANWIRNDTPVAVLNMPFDTNVFGVEATVKDYSGFGNAGALGNSTSGTQSTWNSSGKVGGAYQFDGVNDFINISHSNSLNLTNLMSVEVWIKPSMVHESGGNYGVMAKASNPSWSWQLRFGNDAAGDRLGFQFNNGSLPGVWVNVDQNLATGQWHHIFGTYNQTHVSIYLNGVLKEVKTISALQTPLVPLVIGNDGWPANFFNGTIDEVRIYNRSLSKEQIYENYLAGLINHSVEKILDQETISGDNWSVSLTPNDAKNDGITALSNNLYLANSPPNTILVEINSSLGNNLTLEDLNCYASIFDSDTPTVYANYTWYNNSVSFLSGRTGPFARDNNFLIATLGNGNTSKWDNWTCSIQAYDGSLYEGDWNNATLMILNTLPNVTLVLPEDNNITYNRTPAFYWDGF
ncbi:MAG: LamG-like jellyroll fold domain-containing protein, partial [Nanoarchaeota archaeon]